MFVLGGTAFAMGLVCGAPAKYYELKKWKMKTTNGGDHICSPAFVVFASSW
jgi:hypothetical protein